MFAGTPDQVYRQMKKLYDHVGGFGHLLIMGQAGFLEHDETVLGIRTFARELYPRLKEEFPDTVITGCRMAGVTVRRRSRLKLQQFINRSAACRLIAAAVPPEPAMTATDTPRRPKPAAISFATSSRPTSTRAA